MPTAILTGSLVDYPSGEVAAPICARLELATGLERRIVTLSSDSSTPIPLSGASISALRIFIDPKLNTSTKVTAKITSIDGSAQLIPVDPILTLFAQSVPITALELIRVAGQVTIVDLTLGQKATQTMTTATKPRTVQEVLDEANPSEVASALQKAKLGSTLAPLKRAFTGLAAAAAFDLTLIDGTGETPAGVGNPSRLAALLIGTLRCTASGTANSVGSYAIGDVGATPLSPTASANVGLATISDDGKTITFPSTVTAFVIEYMPRMRSSAEWTEDFAKTS